MSERNRIAMRLADEFSHKLIEAKFSGAEGCAVLALTYAMWIEQQPDGEAEHITAMMRAGQEGAQIAFQHLRSIRQTQQQISDEAMAACFGKPRQ